jgi:nucleoside 2-deoxyribosyltransferase
VAIVAYLAGPDVFLPDAHAHARRKLEICARHGLVGRGPLDEEPGEAPMGPGDPGWQALFRRLLARMEGCDAVIANLTPFRGPSADAGTLVELGWFLGRGRPAFGYSNCALPFAERTGRHLDAAPDPLPGIAVEAHGLPDNLMVPGAVLEGGGLPVTLPPDGRDRAFDALDVFERCVEAAAWRLGLRPRPGWCPPG